MASRKNPSRSASTPSAGRRGSKAETRGSQKSAEPRKAIEPKPPVRRPVLLAIAFVLFFAWLAFLMWMAAISVSRPRAPEPVNPGGTSAMRYPATRRVEQTDDFHGTQVSDPYRWLEASDTEEVRRWVAEQNRTTRRFLERTAYAEPLRHRLTQLWDYERFSQPVKRGGKYFFTRNDGLQNQPVLYVADSLEDEGRVLLDPNSLSEEGTTALSGWEPSDDGQYVAYGLQRDGSDWQTWHVVETETGRRLLDEIRWVKFSSAAWSADSRGFYYSRYDEPKPGEEFVAANYHQKLYYHRLGDPQFQDRLIYERPDEKEWGFSGQVSEDGRFLFISVWRGTERKTQVFVQDLQTPEAPVRELITGFDADYNVLGSRGTTLYLLTDHEAPRRRVVAIDILAPGPLVEVIPEGEEVLSDVSYAAQRFFAHYSHHAAIRIEVLDEAGTKLTKVELPGIGTAGGFHGRREDTELFYMYTDFTTPSEIYRYEPATGRSELFRRPETPFATEEYETRQVFVTSPDGTQVPMFLVARRNLPAGPRPTLLTAYGGFNISLHPGYSPVRAIWLEMGGVLAVANLRGGGEYGREWHEAGMLAKKQNVFDDFIACSEYLIEEGITSREQLAIEGRSNGGLLVGAAITQRPELYAAAVPVVGVHDMLRYHLFTIGWAWVPEYGSAENPEQFPFLRAYSPLHNVREGTAYPATLVMAADTDDRVVPVHSYKFGAALQAAQAGDAPILLRIETSAGHGAGIPTSKKIDEVTDLYTFLAAALKFEPELP